MAIDRRSLVLGIAAMLGTGRAAAETAPTGIHAADPPSLPLWPGPPPGGGGPVAAPDIDGNGALSRIAVPGLEVVRPSRPNGAAMLVAAGGGYRRIEMEREARPAARWLAARGITAFVLGYRLPREGWRDGPLAPLQDAQRALRLIRARAVGYGVDPERVGVLGFSAGGHLMGLAAARSDFAAYRPVDATDELSARPFAAALIYPIITLEPPYDRTSTRLQLVGRHPDPGMATAWSVETHVTSRCPPVFLTQALDDAISGIANTRIMVEACERAGVGVEAHELAGGGHGFAMGRPGTPSADWPAWYEAWLHRSGVPA